MTEEDKEKAEKVAAARKKYEQLKKQKAKKGGASKKKGDKTDKTDKTPASAEQPEASTAGGEKPEDKPTDPTPPEPADATVAPAAVDDDEPSELPKSAAKSHGRKPSVAVESRLRSESFYRSSDPKSPASPPPMAMGGGVSGDIYREQAHRIEELEKENKRLAGEVEEAERRWQRGEEELEELRAEKGDVAVVVEKGKEAEKLTEVESLKRQLSQLQAQKTKDSRRTPATSPNQSASIDDLNAQVASKCATIESLELELSNLNKQLADSESKNNDLQTQLTSLESALQNAKDEATSAKTELADLKENLKQASSAEAKSGDSEQTDAAATEIAELKASLSAHKHTLTQLHRDNDARHKSREQEHTKLERETAELRTRIAGLSNENARLREAEQRRRKVDLSNIEDGSVQELLDEEREKLMTRVRELEEENFELKRGVWRDKRMAMQPSIDDEHGQHGPYASARAEFQDVDLTGNTPGRQTAIRQGSSFQDVIKSGISAFTGQARRTPEPTHRAPGQTRSSMEFRNRQPSLTSLDDELEFDEEAFRKAQEEEMKRRIERVREVKRGLRNWEGWRVDLVDVRAGLGGVFEV
ncbi:hypothetical protein M011DRAFT_336160 [Sporormia fimetaria CBS 119925]|uniref:M protein repeat protein n=1 Tax=Sporormia fimetaria CBS 119925 TaxID=1340428 RepID=A0A6A6VET1_9PLEO|nr:hypothetical protein M011DRAFT_336160 [Sporormia fimetaria CBS 119925]